MDAKTKPQDNTVVQLIEILIESAAKLSKFALLLLLEVIRRGQFKKLNSFFESAFFKQISISKTKEQRITTKQAKIFTSRDAELETMIKCSQDTPIGVSLLSGEIVHLTRRELNQHVLVAGATGEGKTTLMTTKIRHALLNKRPIIIIDPKGDSDDVEKVRQFAILAGRGAKFKLISLAFPENSWSYNPLKIGTPEQLKSKLLEALGLEHEYYGNVAAQFLGNLFDILKFTKLTSELNLLSLYRFITSPNDLGRIDNALKNMPRSPELMPMMAKMHAIKNIDRKDLQGLAAHISSMCLSEFETILDTAGNLNREVDFLSALNNGEILYFQLNLLAYSDFGRRLGKLLLQDLKLVTGQIHSKQVKKTFDFGLCFVDEFGSYAIAGFAELLQQVRSAGIGVNLFFQGIADLNAVSPEFAHQVLGNTKVKIILRQDIDSDVETWAAMAGTVDDEIHSFQVESAGLTESRTGLGNVHDGKKVRIEFDVFKRLSVGEAIVINKGRHTEDLIQIWQQDLTKIQLGMATRAEKPSLFSHHKIQRRSTSNTRPTK